MQRPYRNGVLGKPQRTMSLVRKITFKEIAEVSLQCFYKTLEQLWNNLFERNFADLGYVFVYFLRD